MKHLINILLLFLSQTLFAQQIYFEEDLSINSTPIDTTLEWYGVYRKTDINPRVLEQRLFLKPVTLQIKKDSSQTKVSTSDSTKSEYLIGFKNPINLDSFPDFHFLIDHNINNHQISSGSKFHFAMGEKGMLKIYANGITQRIDDSTRIDNYELITAYQCNASPYMRMRGWQYSLNLDIYEPCKKEKINHVFDLKTNGLTMDDLPYFVGAIDLNLDKLLDLIFISNGYYYLLLSSSEKDNEKYFNEIKTMKLEFGFF